MDRDHLILSAQEEAVMFAISTIAPLPMTITQNKMNDTGQMFTVPSEIVCEHCKDSSKQHQPTTLHRNAEFSIWSFAMADNTHASLKKTLIFNKPVSKDSQGGNAASQRDAALFVHQHTAAQAAMGTHKIVAKGI